MVMFGSQKMLRKGKKMQKKIIFFNLDDMKNLMEKNIKKNIKGNIIIFSLIFSLKNNEENKREREGKRGENFIGLLCLHRASPPSPPPP